MLLKSPHTEISNPTQPNPIPIPSTYVKVTDQSNVLMRKSDKLSGGKRYKGKWYTTTASEL